MDPREINKRTDGDTSAWLSPRNPAVLGLEAVRPGALRPHLSMGLPFRSNSGAPCRTHRGSKAAQAVQAHRCNTRARKFNILIYRRFGAICGGCRPLHQPDLSRAADTRLRNLPEFELK
jgi:hypothetical protein